MYENYFDALGLLDKFLAVATPEANTPAAHEAYDDLFVFIYDNFAIPESAFRAPALTAEHPEHAAAKPIYDKTYPGCSAEFEAALRSIPPVFPETVWPVAVLRFIMRDKELSLNHRELKTFTTMRDRYWNIMMADYK